ncbi:Terminal uridylyltransferase 7, partial [Bienertia sinuspersici]
MESKNIKVCPRFQQKLDKEKAEAAYCFAFPSSTNLFHVNHRLDAMTMNLKTRTCTCRKWDVTGIPFCHAIALLQKGNLQTYNIGIQPCPGERHWPNIDMPLDPPPIKIGPGRPRKNRTKHPMEDPKKKGRLTKHGVEMSCSVCKSKSHNKRTCPDEDKAIQLEPPVTRGRGRPRKESNVNVEPTQVNQPSHHAVTTQPSRTGRGSRIIVADRGSRGGGRGSRVVEEAVEEVVEGEEGVL